jgi:phage tail sheath gpL-like
MSLNRWVILDDANGISPSGMSNIDGPQMMRKCSDHLGRGAQGAMSCNLSLALNPVAALATVTASGNGTANDTLTIGNVVITIVASGATGNQVNVGTAGTGVDLAASIAALVNSSSSFAGICTASAASGVITLTAAIPGTIGNGMALAKSSSALALTHLWGASVAGSEGTAAVFSIGK